MNLSFVKGVAATLTIIGSLLLTYALGVRDTCQSWHYTFEDQSIEICELLGVMPDESANLTFKKVK